jgi:uncharacterized protein
MTPEESQMLNDLADKIAKTPSPAHDAEAEQFIRTRIGSRPDALYIMTQTVLIQNMAIEHARQQIQELQQRAAQGPAAVAPAGGSFVGGGRQPGYAAAPSAPPPNYAQAPPAYDPPPSGASSFLRSAATTAAGVAAGALAFEGIRSLFGGLGNLGGFGGGGFGGGGMHSSFLGGSPETVVNNYYDSPETSDRDAVNAGDSDNSGGDTGGQDLAGQDDDSAQSVDDSGDADNSGGDDGGTDSGGGDDGGGGGGDWV